MAVDFAEAGLLVGGYVSTVADEVLVGLIEEAELFAIESELFTLFVDSLDAGEELFVEHDVVAVGGEQRRYLFGDLLHLVGVDAL